MHDRPVGTACPRPVDEEEIGVEAAGRAGRLTDRPHIVTLPFADMSTSTLLDLARSHRALSDPARIRILAMLASRHLCVCEVVAVLGLSQPTVSQHLAILKDAGLVRDESRGRWSHYRLSPADVDRKRLVRLALHGLKSDAQVQEDARRLDHPDVRKLTPFCGAKVAAVRARR